MAQAADLIRMAWDNGTRTIITTPHYRGEYRKNTPEHLRSVFDELQEFAARNFPDMNLYLGNEIYYESAAPERLYDGRILSLNQSNYALIEFRYHSERSQILTAVSEIIRYGYTPVIAHAERYDVMRSDRDLVDDVLEQGALIQLNADSIMGCQGFSVKHFCQNLLKQGKVHFVASDAHDTVHRPPVLRDCFLRVHKKYGADYAARIFYSNAQAVIENRTI